MRADGSAEMWASTSRAPAAIVLGLAAGALTLDDTLGLVDIDGDEAAVRAILDARYADTACG